EDYLIPEVDDFWEVRGEINFRDIGKYVADCRIAEEAVVEIGHQVFEVGFGFDVFHKKGPLFSSPLSYLMFIFSKWRSIFLAFLSYSNNQTLPIFAGNGHMSFPFPLR